MRRGNGTMKRELTKLAGGILLVGIAMQVALTACSGSTGGTTPASSGAAAAAAQPVTSAAPAANPQPAAQPATQAASAPPAAQPPNQAASNTLAQGKLIFDKTAGGVGCAYCHGFDGKGQGAAGVGAPDNRGASEEKVRNALAGGVPLMSFIKLTDEEVTAVIGYLKYLNEQP